MVIENTTNPERTNAMEHCTCCLRTAEEAGCDLQIVLLKKGEALCCEECQWPLDVRACAHCARLIVPSLLAYVEDARPGYYVCDDCENGPPAVALAAAARVQARARRESADA